VFINRSDIALPPLPKNPENYQINLPLQRIDANNKDVNIVPSTIIFKCLPNFSGNETISIHFKDDKIHLYTYVINIKDK
jgi:hypothetical protein